MSSAWCKSDSMEISTNGTTGCFFGMTEGGTATVNTVCYEVMLGTFLWNELWFKFNLPRFQQNAANAQTTCKVSGQCFQADPLLVVEKSPDLLPPDLAGCCYYLWSYVKRKIQETHPVNIDEAKQPIMGYIQRIPMEILKRVTPSFPSRLQECTKQHSGHLHDISFKQQW
jgi:hypothetical protein